MQQSSQILFCDECGLANELAATHCSACQRPLVHTSDPAGASSSTPVIVVPPPVREVTPGLPSPTGKQGVASDIRPGTILADSYRIQKEIGRGGFSIVYRATEVDAPGRQVAIKRIPLNALTPSQAIEATETFNREISALTKFSGISGIPKFYGHLTDQENWYLIMEYIEGETLEAYLQTASDSPTAMKYPPTLSPGYFDEAKTLYIGMELALILSKLHTNRPSVIFRDVKPANIMLTPRQELYLIDFGIARNFKWGKARDTTPLGSPGYAAPEQYGRVQTNQRSDIYGLGATLQTLITGRDPLELAAGEAPRNPQPPSPELRALLDEMLSPDPMRRPTDMLAVRGRLIRIVPPPSKQRLDQRSWLKASFGLFAICISAWRMSTWLGIASLINLCFSIGVYNQWFDTQRLLGKKGITIARVIVALLWLILVLLVVILFLWFLFTNIRL